MKKILFLAVVAMMATMSATAQTSLTGRVYHHPNIMALMFAGKINIDHHVHATIVAIADNWLAFTVQYLAAHVLDVNDTLERLQIVTTVMTREEKTDIVLFHVALNPLGSVHLGREVGEYQQVSRAKSITAEADIIFRQ